MRHQRARRHLPRVADAHEFVAQARAVGANGIERVIERQATGVYERSHHVRVKACALFIGERRHGYRERRHDARVTKRPDDGQTAQHTVAAVKRTGIDDGVDVRAHHERARRLARGVFLRWRERAENVADAIDLHVEIEFAHPGDHLIAAGLLGIGEGDAGAPPRNGIGTDLT